MTLLVDSENGYLGNQGCPCFSAEIVMTPATPTNARRPCRAGLAETVPGTYMKRSRLAIFYTKPADLTPEQVEAWLCHPGRRPQVSYSTP